MSFTDNAASAAATSSVTDATTVYQDLTSGYCHLLLLLLLLLLLFLSSLVLLLRLVHHTRTSRQDIAIWCHTVV